MENLPVISEDQKLKSALYAQVDNIKLLEGLKSVKAIAGVDNAKAVEKTLTASRKILKDAEEMRMSFTRPLDETKKRIKSIADEFINPHQKEIDRIGGVLNAFYAEEERKRKLALKKIKHDQEIERMATQLAIDYENLPAKAAEYFMKNMNLSALKKDFIPDLPASYFDAVFDIKKFIDFEFLELESVKKKIEEIKSQLPYAPVNQTFKSNIEPLLRDFWKTKEAPKIEDVKFEKVAAPVKKEDDFFNEIRANQAASPVLCAPIRKVKMVGVMNANLSKPQLVKTALQLGYQSKAFDDILQVMSDYLANIPENQRPVIEGLSYEVK